MFGFGAFELFIILIAILALSAVVKSSREKKESSRRRCLTCGHIGEMETWCESSWLPNFVIILGFCFFFIPGLIFMMYAWGKRKCQNCGALDKCTLVSDQEGGVAIIASGTKECPFCAETVKSAAIVCRFCNRELSDP